MIRLKTAKEIETMRRGGRLLATVLDEVVAAVKPGVTALALDGIAEDLILAGGAVPAFKNYVDGSGRRYPNALCASVNHQVVHTPPSSRKLKEGDIIGLDLGVRYHGLYLDMSRTVPVGRVSDEARRLIAVTEEALERGIAAATPGARIGDIAAAVQSFVEENGFSVVRQLVGHGVGHEIHEDPRVPNFGTAGTGELIEPGLVIAIEPMVNVGEPAVEVAPDGWTFVTSDGSLSAHSEHTVAITAAGPQVLTRA